MYLKTKVKSSKVTFQIPVEWKILEDLNTSLVYSELSVPLNFFLIIETWTNSNGEFSGERPKSNNKTLSGGEKTFKFLVLKKSLEYPSKKHGPWANV